MPDFEELAAAVFPGPLSTNVYDGHTYGLPLDTNTRVFMWNPHSTSRPGWKVHLPRLTTYAPSVKP